MKLLLGLTAILTMSYAVLAADAPGKVTYVGHDKVNAAIQKGGSLVTAPDLTVTGSHREKAGQVEVHDRETDIIYMIEGEATFVTGGTVVGLKTTRPGQLRASWCSKPILSERERIGRNISRRRPNGWTPCGFFHWHD